MTPFEAMDQFREIIANLVSRKATGRHVFVVDMNQGGIGSCSMFGASRTEGNETLFITSKGIQVLTKI